MWRRGRWLACVLLVALGAACGGDGNGNPGARYPDRANQYREDQERRIGESAMIGGFTTTVTDVRLDDGSIRVSVEITNRNRDPQRIDSTQWTLVNPRIQTIEATSADFPRTELPGGEIVTAEVSFAVDPDETGDYYVQYKPKVLDAARGIWRYTVRGGSGSAARARSARERRRGGVPDGDARQSAMLGEEVGRASVHRGELVPHDDIARAPAVAVVQ